MYLIITKILKREGFLVHVKKNIVCVYNLVPRSKLMLVYYVLCASGSDYTRDANVTAIIKIVMTGEWNTRGGTQEEQKQPESTLMGRMTGM